MATPHPHLAVHCDDHIARVALNRPPHNFLDLELVRAIADSFEALSRDDACRVILLSSQVKSFCAGADFSGTAADQEAADPAPFYREAMRLFACTKPIVCAIGGAAIGAGLGLALACDFRIATPAARFSANFCRLGFHPGFALSFTLPRLVGAQRAAQLFYTGSRIDGERAERIGLVDETVDDAMLASAAEHFAREIAASAPLAVVSTRATLRAGQAEQAIQANQRELALQREQFRTHDFREGVSAMAERRLPRFAGN
jgi:enoyl-CoA hydratase/carnithine racemase